MSSHLESHGYNSMTKTTETQIIDKDMIRQKLRDEGSVCLTERDPDPDERSFRYVEPNKIECNFGEDEMNLFDLCGKLEKEILAGLDDGSWSHTGMPIGLNLSLQKDYGVAYPNSTSWAGYTTQKQFVRSIFLLFTRATSEVIADEDGSRKKRPVALPPKRSQLQWLTQVIHMRMDDTLVRRRSFASTLPVKHRLRFALSQDT